MLLFAGILLTPVWCAAQDEHFAKDSLAAAEKPRFPGCEDLELSPKDKHTCSEKKLFEYVYLHTRYPREALKKGISGTAVLQFIVKEDGTIGEVKVIKDPGAGLGQEAKRTVQSMTPLGIRWIPAELNGQAVPYEFTLPVNFKLE